jgi:nuclear pore complex protein Nup98-Nup96
MEQVRNNGNELAIVHEEEVPPATPKPFPTPATLEDQEPGTYWMKPTRAEIEQMTREERAAVHDFTVGREGVGQVCFSKVDLRNINLDDIFDKFVRLVVRSATVYPDAATRSRS